MQIELNFLNNITGVSSDESKLEFQINIWHNLD